VTTRPQKAPPGPRRPLGGFIHLLARFYQNYRRAIVLASKRKRNRGVDVDTQLSKDGTMWALHWATVGKNKLRDPTGHIKKTARIEHLTDEQIETLRGPKSQHPHRTQHLVDLAARLGVRLEVELKVFVPVYTLKQLLISSGGVSLNKRQLLQFKVRAALHDSVGMLTQAHNAGGTTIISWEDYHGPGIDKMPAWHVVDYSRGRSHWIA
jgi:hypothetical protein